MNFFKHYLILGVVFTLLFTSATIGLELLEGNKLTTTEYYGLNNLGFTFILYISVLSFLLYPVSFLPLTLLVHKFTNLLIGRIFIYSSIAGLIGIWVFNKLYNYRDGSFIKEYELNINSAILVFGIAGFIYALIDYYFKMKTRGAS